MAGVAVIVEDRKPIAPAPDVDRAPAACQSAVLIRLPEIGGVALVACYLPSA
jgi:hypothetical protein